MGFKIFATCFVIMIIASIALLIYTAILTGDAVSKESDKYDARKELIGKRVVIDRDTLTITDYNYLKGNYTLSNGVKIDAKFVSKNHLP